MKVELTELHKEAFATWRFQIESYWTRNGYFAGFETAALGGVWTISREHPCTGFFAAVMGICLTLIWFFSCDRQHEYVRFWWDKLIEFDAVQVSAWQAEPQAEGVRPILLASDFERWRSARNKRARWRRYEYSMLMLLVPVIFGVLWLSLVGYTGHILESKGLFHFPWKR